MLHLFCGKIAAGKSTLARQLAAAEGAVLISEDAWMHSLFADELKTGADYLRCSAKLRAALGPHLTDLLRRKLTLVLDLQANTAEVRTWLRQVIETSGTAHQMHVLDPPDEVCLARLKARNAGGTHPFMVSEAQFLHFTKHFAPPAPDEGFNLIYHDTAWDG